MGGNHDKKAKPTGEDGKGQFGGSFWPQLDNAGEEWSWATQIDTDEISQAVEDFLPQVSEMNDGALFAEVAELSQMTENEMLAQLEIDGYNKDEFVKTVRLMAAQTKSSN